MFVLAVTAPSFARPLDKVLLLDFDRRERSDFPSLASRRRLCHCGHLSQDENLCLHKSSGISYDSIYRINNYGGPPLPKMLGPFLGSQSSPDDIVCIDLTHSHTY